MDVIINCLLLLSSVGLRFRRKRTNRVKPMHAHRSEAWTRHSAVSTKVSIDGYRGFTTNGLEKKETGTDAARGINDLSHPQSLTDNSKPNLKQQLRYHHDSMVRIQVAAANTTAVAIADEYTMGQTQYITYEHSHAAPTTVTPATSGTQIERHHACDLYDKTNHDENLKKHVTSGS
jgi:hypothetical protein